MFMALGGEMMGLKIAGACWVASLVGFLTVGQITPADAGEKLMYGSVQVVLGVCVLGLSLAVVWLARRLLMTQEKRVMEATTRGDEIKEVLNGNQKSLEQNAVAISENATASQQLKEAVYRLSQVVDKKMDVA